MLDLVEGVHVSDKLPAPFNKRHFLSGFLHPIFGERRMRAVATKVQNALALLIAHGFAPDGKPILAIQISDLLATLGDWFHRHNSRPQAHECFGVIADVGAYVEDQVTLPHELSVEVAHAPFDTKIARVTDASIEGPKRNICPTAGKALR
jgi:hypothetical protein